MLQVYILTRCESPQSLYGSLLVFPTLRTGFPTARIHVFENSSHPEAREPIRAAALQCQAEFTQLEREVGHHGFLDSEPFKPVAFKLNSEWHRFDTGGSLLAAFPDRFHFFSESELDCYDHLFCGSHLDYVAPRLTGESGELLRKLHADVQRDPNALRGAWRKQEEHFASRAIE